MTIRLWVPGHGAARPGRAGRRGRLARRPHRHRPRRPAAAARRLVTGAGRCGWPARRSSPCNRSRPGAPLRALAGAAAGLAAGERAVGQVLARPVAGARLRRARRAARRQRAGPPRPACPCGWPGRLLAAVVLRRRRGPRRAPARPGPELAPEVRAALGKLAGPAVGDRDPLRGHRPRPARRAAGGRRRPGRGCAGLAHGLASPAALFTGRNWLARRRLRRPAAAARRPAAGRGATCCRSPSWPRSRACPPTRRCPGLARAGARAVAPPPAVPAPGPGARPLGVTDAGVPRPVGIAVADARHHLRVMRPDRVRQDHPDRRADPRRRRGGRGVVFIDPKGDAVTDLLARLPAHAGGEGGAVRPRRPGGAAVPERAARRPGPAPTTT